MNLLDVFDRAYVINLPDRADRRREMEHELRRPDLGLREDQLNRVQFFGAIRPQEPAPFPSVGIKGCFLSHLAVLRDAKERGLARVLVLEDDAQFSRGFEAKSSAVLLDLAEREWGIVHLGYMGGPSASKAGGREAQLLEFSGEVTGTHCYGVSRRALEGLVAHFEVQRTGRLGDDLYGPMPVDGTLNVFRWLNPSLPRLLVVPSLVRQRSSRSDVTPGRLDRIGFLQPVLRLARAIRARNALG